ncbi:urease accessory protein UreH [Hoeflea sp. IMCC20628]|uniref:urease accessory protein UreD n=1 Tax=Hoeflea sp. IMCC20628 TaxID=1620421 RepID=UPI00063BF482|nr:urease accessory protein UreD [Hoeflea sp. IMCC20628]AKI01598.1 urease accessory protein UreH [Hoeflea sp. IMCC20628]
MTSMFPLPAPQSSVPMQRTQGGGRLSVKLTSGQSRIDRLFQEGAARIRVPRVPQGSPLEAVLINTAGGLTGGDRMEWSFEAGEGASMTLATQACEKTYKAHGLSEARVSVKLKLNPSSSLAWLPQETILFDRARLARTIDVDMVAGSRLLMLEPVVFGRLAMNEAVTEGLFRDRWRIRLDGQLLHAEDMRLGPDIASALGRTAVANGGLAMATLLLVAPDAEARLNSARTIISQSGGVSYIGARRPGGPGMAETGKLLARVVAKDSYELRKVLVPLIHLLNPLGGVPKVWSI